MATNNKLIIGAGSAIAVVIVAFAASSAVLADSENGRSSLAERIATRFNLNQDEVQGVFEEHRQERKQAHLDAAVEEGLLTQEQRQALEQKHLELADRKAELKDLSPEERRAASQEIRQEMDAWAEENGIDLQELRPDKRGFKAGYGFKHNQ